MGRLLFIPELMEKLNIGRNVAYELCRTKGFPSVYLADKWRVDEDLLEEWLKEQARNKHS